MDTDALLSSVPGEPGRFAAEIPDGWQQGRGAYGGLVTGLLVRTLEAAVPGRPLRSLTSELCGPVTPGPLELAVEVLREGSAVTTAVVRAMQGGEVLAHATGVHGLPRPATPREVHLPAPERPDWARVEPVPVGPPGGPIFARQFEYRPLGYLPFSGHREGRAEGYVRPLVRGARRDAGYLAFCIDAWWPTAFAIAERPRPMATIAFTFQPFARFEGLDADAPLLHRAHLQASDDGYCVEQRELWGLDGRLLALNQQTLVIIK